MMSDFDQRSPVIIALPQFWSLLAAMTLTLNLVTQMSLAVISDALISIKLLKIANLRRYRQQDPRCGCCWRGLLSCPRPWGSGRRQVAG